MMPRLPPRPIFFIPFYLLLSIVAVYPKIAGATFAPYCAIIGTCGVVLLHLFWVFQAIAFVAGLSIPSRKISDQRRLVKPLSIIGVCVVYAATFDLFLKPHLFAGTPVEEILRVVFVIAVIFAAIAFFAIFWIAARTICEAEEDRKVTAYNIVGTFLLVVYIVIGAPFIYARLQRLSEKAPRSAAAS